MNFGKDIDSSKVLGLGRQEGSGQDDAWAVSYSDLVTLLLVFFVILVAASKIDNSKLEELQKMIKGEEVETSPKKAHITELSQLLEKHGLSDAVTIVDDEDGILIVIKDRLLFDSGKSEISPESAEKLAPVFKAFHQLPKYYRFSIEGHTDDAPIQTIQFPSNWHLAAARSIAVVRLFELHEFDRKRISAHSFADTRPLLPNRSTEGSVVTEHRRRNRRVVIRIR